MVKKERKRTGYSLIVAIGLFLLIAVLLYGLYFVNDVRTELWDSSLSTIIENTDCATDMITGKINAEKRSLQVQGNALESLTSSDIDTIGFLLDGFDSKEYSVTLVVGETTYPAKNSFTEALPNVADTKINIVPPFISSNSGKRVIALTQTLTFQDGVTGSFIREIPVNDLNNAFTVSFFQDRGHSYMIDGQGDILFRSVTTSGNKTSHNLFSIFEDEAGNDHATINELKELVANGRSGWAILKYNGLDKLYCFSPIESTSWLLVSVVQVDLITEQSQNILEQTFILSGIIFFGFLFLIGMLIIRERQNQKRIEQENSLEKRMIIASNSEVKTIVMGVNLESDSYKIISQIQHEGYNIAHTSTFSELIASFADLVDEEYREEYKRCFGISNLRKLASQEHKYEYREFSIQLNGEKHWIAAEAVLVNDEDTPGSLVYSSRVIDAAKKEEEERREVLQNALNMAEQATKAKSVFLSNMSHDIRTPMNAIIGFTNIALRHPTEPEVKCCLEKIGESSDHLLTLINDVLDISRIESGKTKYTPSPVDITKVTDAVLDITKGFLINRNLTFDIHRAKLDKPYVMADAVRIREVLVNILGNAVKFTPDGGTIWFQTEYFPGEDDCHIIVRYRISDTGVGMSEEFMDRVFDDFAQEENGARTQYKGTGLGMAITKQYVDLMGGTISVESKKGNGSTFTVDLPLEMTGIENIDKQEMPRAKENLRGIRVLLAEDNDLNAEIAEIQLEELGMKVTRANDGKQAVELFSDNPADTFDVILMDIMMPQMNGYEATKEIRSLSNRPDGCSIPIIAMTANAFAEDVQASLDAGMNGHLSKPIVIDEVVKTIARNMER